MGIHQAENDLINVSNEISHVIDIINEITEDDSEQKQQKSIINAIRCDPDSNLEEKEFNKDEFIWELRAYIGF